MPRTSRILMLAGTYLSLAMQERLKEEENKILIIAITKLNCCEMDVVNGQEVGICKRLWGQLWSTELDAWLSLG